MITFDSLKKDPQIITFVRAAGDVMKSMNFTEHSFAHVYITAYTAAEILTDLGADKRDVELVKIAGLLHDVGNMINRSNHSITGATIALKLLMDRGMDDSEIAKVVAAIGNHDEGTGKPVSNIAAALILADKSDVRRSRVLASVEDIAKDIHDRVNYAVDDHKLSVIKNGEETVISMRLSIDTSICAVMDYFAIFLERMLMCGRAAEFLGAKFELIINGQKVL